MSPIARRGLVAAALLAPLALAAPALARPTGHLRVVQPGTALAVLGFSVSQPGQAASPAPVSAGVVVGGDEGHLATHLKDGTHLALRFAVRREAAGYVLYATTSSKAGATLKRVAVLAPGDSTSVPGPGKATIIVTLVRVQSVGSGRP